MQLIPVVENPRRKRRRYTAKQRAAGFGGGRRRTRRRRRNPTLATLANPRRRRRSSMRSAPRRRRGRRNPGGFKGVFRNFDLPAAGWTAAGMVGTRALPGLIGNWFPMLPTAGPMGYLTKAGAVAALGWATGQFVGQRQAQHVTNGGLALLALDLFDTYLAPKLGMGLGGFVSTDEIARVTSGGLAGFVPAPAVVDGMGGVFDTDPMSA